MKLRNRWLTACAVSTLGTLAACESDSTLAVKNTNNPDVARAFATADGIEAILRSGFSQIFGATHGTTSLQPSMMVFALESYGSVANFNMNLRATFPRVPIDNNRGNATANENLRDFQQLSLRGRTIANAIGALDRLVEAKGSLGSPAQNARARSFGFFTLGMANGEMALLYDSVGVSAPALATTDVPGLVGYQEAMGVALQQLDSALAIANGARTLAGTNGFPMPREWLRTTTGTTSLDDYIRLVRTTKARLRANVARNPAERTAVNWAAVVADAQAGITSDFTLDLNSNEGWGNAWLNQAMVFTGWHNMTSYIIGMADTTNGYSDWLAAPRGARAPSLIMTPDQRFPAGSTRAAQQASSPAAAAVLPSVYFRNRIAGEDTPGEAWGLSFYDFVRYRHYRVQSSVGPWNWITRTENELLAAEGLIRLNRAAEAVPLINRTRVANGLPGYASATTAAPAQPGGSATSCVPRSPTGAGGALQCGSLLEGLKWEKRMETLFSGYGVWFLDSRGWGDLPVNTPVMWPVPFQEMDARRQAFYNSQTGDAKWQAQTNTYNFGVGSR